MELTLLKANQQQALKRFPSRLRKRQTNGPCGYHLDQELWLVVYASLAVNASVTGNLLRKPQIADTEVQELAVRESGVDWVLAQPVHLTDDDSGEMPFASADGQVHGWKISRKGVAEFLALAAQVPEYLGQSIALSEHAVAAT